MSRHVFHEIYLHLNRHTKASRSLFGVSLEPAVQEFLCERFRTRAAPASTASVGQKTRKALEWQRRFRRVSFGKRQLAWVLKYIADQKEHHARGSIQDRLERVAMEEGDWPLESA